MIGFINTSTTFSLAAIQALQGIANSLYISISGDWSPNPNPTTEFNVLNYGLVGDGVTDDSAALNALALNTGVTNWYFPEGYTFLLYSITPPEHVTHLWGGGTLRRKWVNIAYQHGTLMLENTTVIDGLTFEEGTTSGTWAGDASMGQILFSAWNPISNVEWCSDQIEIRNCTIDSSDILSDGISVFNNGTAGDGFNKHKNIKIYNNHFVGNLHFAAEIGDRDSRHSETQNSLLGLEVFDNIIDGGNGFSLSRIRSNSFAKCYNNTFNNCKWGTEITTCDGLHFNNNLILGTTKHCVVESGPQSNVWGDDYNFSIGKNYIYNNHMESTGSDELNFINIYAGNNSEWYGNYLNTPLKVEHTGYAMLPPEIPTFHDNTIINNGGIYSWCIRFVDTPNCVLTNNNIYGMKATTMNGVVANNSTNCTSTGDNIYLVNGGSCVLNMVQTTGSCDTSYIGSAPTYKDGAGLINMSLPTITIDRTVLSLQDDIGVTFTFPQAELGFNQSHIIVPANTILESLTSVDGGLSYTATLTASAGVFTEIAQISVSTAYSDIFTIATDYTSVALPTTLLDVTSATDMAPNTPLVADAGTDQSALMQAILNDTNIDNVYFPQGVYLLKRLLGGSHLKAITGEGTLRMAADSANHCRIIMMNENGRPMADNFLVDGLTFESEPYNYFSVAYGLLTITHGSNISTTDGVDTNGLTIRNCRFDLADVGTGAVEQIKVFAKCSVTDPVNSASSQHHNMSIHDNVFTNISANFSIEMGAIGGPGSTTSNLDEFAPDLRIFSNSFSTHGGTGALSIVRAGGQGSQGYVFGNSFDNNGWGVETAHSLGVQIFNNRFTNFTGSMISDIPMRDSNDVANPNNGTYACNIHHNHFGGVYQDDSAFGHVYMYGGSQSNFYDNFLSGQVKLLQQTDAEPTTANVYNNIIVGHSVGWGTNQKAAIRMQGDLVAFTSGNIEGNEVYGTSTSVGIQLSNISTGVTITDNDVRMVEVGPDCISPSMGTQSGNTCTQPYTGDIPTEKKYTI